MLRGLTITLLAVIAVQAQDLPKGQIIDDVKCQADAAQSYALYLPSNYTPDKKWSLLMAFDARARGRTPVERYQAAAEKFGYIVAGSNNSRNGPAIVSKKAAAAMQADLEARFSIDPKRLYAAGQSGGARFAIDLVGGSKGQFAGVIASSAGFSPEMGVDLELPYVVFGTAGTEDFNYIELRRMERSVKTAHRVKIFIGEHTWLPSELAVEALEWMELQAMRTGIRLKDDAMIDRIFAARKAELAGMKDLGEIYYANRNLATDFKGLRDVDLYAKQADEMTNRKDVVEAVRKTIVSDMAESQVDSEILNYSDQLDNEAERPEMMEKLSGILRKLGADAHLAEDTPERRRARRILHGVMADNANRKDVEYRKLLDEVKP